MSGTPAWLRGAVPGIAPYLQPVAHALIDAREAIERVSVPDDSVWVRPGGAASVGFHLRHIGRSLERFLTYARGEALTPEELERVQHEGDPGTPPEPLARLVTEAQAAIEHTLTTLRTVRADELLLPRSVGRRQLPTTVLGIFSHAAEHTARHVGQLATTARLVGVRAESC